MIIEAYEFNGGLSLDREYLEGLANRKVDVKKVQAELDQEAFQELTDASTNTFDFAVYNQLREDDNQLEADKYFEENAKCLAISSYDIHITYL